MSIINRYSYSNNGQNQECSICLEDFAEGDQLAAHTGRGALHPYHLNCLKPWLKDNTTCPNCRNALDIDSLLTLKERIQRIAETVFNDFIPVLEFVGEIVAAAMGGMLSMAPLFVVINLTIQEGGGIIACTAASLGASIISIAALLAFSTLVAAITGSITSSYILLKHRAELLDRGVEVQKTFLDTLAYGIDFGGSEGFEQALNTIMDDITNWRVPTILSGPFALGGGLSFGLGAGLMASGSSGLLPIIGVITLIAGSALMQFSGVFLVISAFESNQTLRNIVTFVRDHVNPNTLNYEEVAYRVIRAN